jgi:hypothetical protein
MSPRAGARRRPSASCWWSQPTTRAASPTTLERHGELWQLREYAALRSLYHLKEADPHAWVIPRLRGRAKAGMVAIEYDEFGAGRAENIHAQLFADLMTELGLDTGYGTTWKQRPRSCSRPST